jgi:tetratricopeptide (TPR) repeat protein
LLRSIAGAFAAADDDLLEAPETFRRDDDRAGVTFTLSFYCRPRRDWTARGGTSPPLEALDVYLALPDDEFVVAVRAYSRALLAMIDGDLTEAERHYRVAADGFRRTDRPVMLAITLGVLADLDERHGHHGEAVEELEEAVDLAEDVGMRGFVGSLYSRLAWSLLEQGDVSRAASTVDQALDAGRRLRSPHILFLAHAVSAPPTSARPQRGRGDSRERSALDPRDERREPLSESDRCRLRDRVGPCRVPHGAGRDRCRTGRSGGRQRLAEADRLRSEVGAPVPRFQLDDVERAGRLALVE